MFLALNFIINLQVYVQKPIIRFILNLYSWVALHSALYVGFIIILAFTYGFLIFFVPVIVLLGIYLVVLILLSLFSSYVNTSTFKSFIFFYVLVLCGGFWAYMFNISLVCGGCNFTKIIYFIGGQGFLGLETPQLLTVYIDSSNILFVILTSSIGVFCTIYSYFYMLNEVFLKKFILLLQFFLASMLFLLVAHSFVAFILGWELIGVFSFLLINFWTNKISTFKSAYKAFAFNKLSDVSLILVFVFSLIYSCPNSIFSSSFFYHTLNWYFYIFNIRIPCLYFCMVFLSICCFCKSAQFGFHVWLPDSMEAPIPASALIHSATLVSAGLYLMHKTSFLFFFYNYTLFLLFWGGFTAFYGSFVALYQTDVKKILAYSTISHCGLLFCLLAVNHLDFFYLYLYSHGIFKSLSFVAAGNIISYSRGYQDSRRIGNFITNRQFYYFILLFSVTGLGGLPFSIGFYSKYFLLINLGNLSVYKLSFVFIYISCLNGIFYSYNILYNLFFSFIKGSDNLLPNFSLSISSNQCMGFGGSILYNLFLVLWVVSVIGFLCKYVVFLSTSQSIWAESLSFYSINFFSIFNYIYIVSIYFFYLTSLSKHTQFCLFIAASLLLNVFL